MGDRVALSWCVPVAGEIPLLSSFLYLLGEKEAEVGSLVGPSSVLLAPSYAHIELIQNRKIDLPRGGWWWLSKVAAACFGEKVGLVFGLSVAVRGRRRS